MIKVTVYAGAVAPEELPFTISPGESGLDLSTVTTVTLRVRSATDTYTDWTTTLSAQSSAEIEGRHVFTAGDVDVKGRFTVSARLAVPGGVIRCNPFELIVA